MGPRASAVRCGAAARQGRRKFLGRLCSGRFGKRVTGTQRQRRHRCFAAFLAMRRQHHNMCALGRFHNCGQRVQTFLGGHFVIEQDHIDALLGKEGKRLARRRHLADDGDVRAVLKRAFYDRAHDGRVIDHQYPDRSLFGHAPDDFGRKSRHRMVRKWKEGEPVRGVRGRRLFAACFPACPGRTASSHIRRRLLQARP